MATVPVSIATDMTSGSTLHLNFPQFIDTVDCAHEMRHPPGHAMDRHSFAWTVKHKGQVIVIDGHDLGPMLQHAGACYFMHELRSSRKNNFAASTVRACKKSTACIDDGWHPMTLCGDPISPPVGRNHTNKVHTVLLGTTLVDEVSGWCNIGAAVVVDLIGAVALGRSALKAPAPFAEKSAFDSINDVISIPGFDLAKAGQSAVASLVSSVIVSGASGWKEPIGVKVEMGSGFAATTFETSIDPQTGESRGKLETKVLGKTDASTWGKPL